MYPKLKYFVMITISLLITQQVRASQSKNDNHREKSIHDPILLASKCPERISTKFGYKIYTPLKTPQKFYQVKTQSGNLRIRSAPGGNVIGGVPSGWQVYVAKFDDSGKWAYIRDINSPYYNTSYGFGSAPDFRADGWVSVDYLTYLGEFCTKPNRLALVPSDEPVSLNDSHLVDTVWHSLATEIIDKINLN